MKKAIVIDTNAYSAFPSIRAGLIPGSIHLDKNKKSSEEASILEVPNFKTDAQFATDRNYG
jgi:hypothetical protein